MEEAASLNQSLSFSDPNFESNNQFSQVPQNELSEQPGSDILPLENDTEVQKDTVMHTKFQKLLNEAE